MEELHEVALSEANGALVVAVIERAFELAGLPVPKPVLAALLRGDEPDAGLVEQARVDVRRKVAGEVRAELLAEFEAERLARPALPAPEPEESDQGEVVDAEVVAEPAAAGVSWDDLPPEWKRGRDKALSVYEYERAVKAEERQRERPPGSGRHHLDFSHRG